MHINNLRRKGLISAYHSQVTPHHWGKLVQKLKAETWIQELKQKPWRINVYWSDPPDLLSLFSCTAQCHPLRGGIVHRGLGPPTIIINLEKVLQTCLQVNLTVAFSLLKVSLSTWFKSVSSWQKTSQHRWVHKRPIFSFNASELEAAEPWNRVKGNWALICVPTS